MGYIYIGLEYDIKKVQENHEGLELNKIYLILVYVGDVTLQEKNINSDIINKITQTLFLWTASKGTDLKVNLQKTKYKFSVSWPESRKK
jgi:hypothetical protein